MKTNKIYSQIVGTIVSIALLTFITMGGANSWARDGGQNDSLYIGDASDGTVKRFDATTGNFWAFLSRPPPTVFPAAAATYMDQEDSSSVMAAISLSLIRTLMIHVQAIFYDTTAKQGFSWVSSSPLQT